MPPLNLLFDNYFMDRFIYECKWRKDYARYPGIEGEVV